VEAGRITEQDNLKSSIPVPYKHEAENLEEEMNVGKLLCFKILRRGNL
jgi:hypothetical protein